MGYRSRTTPSLVSYKLFYVRMPQLVNQICKNPQRAKNQSSATAIICSQLCTTKPLFCYTCLFIPGQRPRRFDEDEIDPPVLQLKPKDLGWCRSLDHLQKLMFSSSEGTRHICLYVPFITQHTKLCWKKKIETLRGRVIIVHSFSFINLELNLGVYSFTKGKIRAFSGIPEWSTEKGLCVCTYVCVCVCVCVCVLTLCLQLPGVYTHTQTHTWPLVIC